MSRSSGRALAALLVARGLMESIGFACLLGLAQGIGGLTSIGLIPTTLGVLGATLILLAALKEASSEGRGTAIVVATLGAGAVLAIALPAAQLDVVGWVGRLIIFVVLAEAYLWRVLTLARGAIRWSDARNAVPFTAVALGLAAIVPLPVDRGPLVPLALIFVAASAVALSVSRSVEELSLTRRNVGQAGLSSANSAMFALGVGAIVAALVVPALEQLLGDLGTAMAPLFDQLLFYILLPLGYLAAAVFFLLEPLLREADFFRYRQSPPPRGPDEEALLREIERTRPFVVGGVEILIILVLILVALILLERAVRERRLAMPEGAELERSAAGGLSFGQTLRSLFPRRPRRRVPPRDDGSPAAAARALYWRFLALADSAGHGWRDATETPAEHQRRILAADARWETASPIVAMFEHLRYGETPPDARAVAAGRAALRSLESALRT